MFFDGMVVDKIFEKRSRDMVVMILKAVAAVMLAYKIKANTIIKRSLIGLLKKIQGLFLYLNR